MMHVLVCLMLLALSLQAELWESKDGKKIDGELAGGNEASIFIRPHGKQIAVSVKRESLAESSLQKADEWLADEQNRARSRWRMTQWRPWPKFFKVNKVKAVRELSESDFVSEHYRLRGDFKISPAVAIAVLREAEYQWQLCEALPLYFKRQANRGQRRFDILLFEKEEDYRKAGGAENTVAMHVWRWRGPRREVVFDAVLIPRSTLNNEKGAGVKRGRIGIVRHELIHQLMGAVQKANPWRMEGMAEFVSTIPRNGKTYDLSRHRNRIVEHLSAKGNGGHRLALGQEIELPKLEKLIKMDLDTLVDEARLNYAASLLLVEFLATSEERYMQKHLELIAEEKFVEANVELAKLVTEIEGKIVDRWQSLGLKLSFK